MAHSNNRLEPIRPNSAPATADFNPRVNFKPQDQRLHLP